MPFSVKNQNDGIISGQCFDYNYFTFSVVFVGLLGHGPIVIRILDVSTVAAAVILSRSGVLVLFPWQTPD